MGRENKKDVVAALHREQIMKAAEKLFSEKGYVQTTIDDISKASEYSRRTIYAYYENKDDILLLGTEINTVLASFIETGKKNGIVRKDIVPMLTVYVLWSSITSLLTLTDTQGQFICNQFSISENEFLDYGFKQLINSILEVRI